MAGLHTGMGTPPVALVTPLAKKSSLIIPPDTQSKTYKLNNPAGLIFTRQAGLFLICADSFLCRLSARVRYLGQYN